MTANRNQNHNQLVVNKLKPVSTSEFSRANIFKYLSIACATSALVVSGVKVNPVAAKTYFDTDVYGDKELKIATVNKLKQKLRNALLNDNTLAPDFIKLAINDALGYDITNEEGGPDGSIIFEMKRPENLQLQNAINAISSIKSEMQRTNTVSFSDIVSFAGAEALESVGCRRVIVQVGRFDAKTENAKANFVTWQNPTKGNLISSFKGSGLSSKDIVLLLGGLGETERIVKENKKKKELLDEENDEESDQQFVPTTFGARDAIYGAKIGKGDFSNKYLNDLLKGKVEDGDIGNLIIQDPEIKALVVKYAGNKDAFLMDLPEAYLKLTLLGEAYTTRNS